MHRLLMACLCAVFATTAFAAKGPEIQIIDNKVSINAEAVPLSRLLRLLDLATGMQSQVPPELANRNISVKFSDLTLDDGVRKLFQGQPLDYVVIPGRGIIVTSASQSGSTTEPVPPYSSPVQVEQPFVQDFAPPLPANQQQPATIQTPFGAIANPRAGQPIITGNTPLTVPGQQNSLFPQLGIQQQNQPGQLGQPIQPIQPMNPSFPGTAPANPPFGGASPFGTPIQQPPNNLFNSSPSGSPIQLQQQRIP